MHQISGDNRLPFMKGNMRLFDTFEENGCFEQIVVAPRGSGSVSLFDMARDSKDFEQFISELVADLFDAGFEGNQKRLELLALNAIRNLRKDSPALSSRLASVLTARRSAMTSLRGIELKAAPVDQDSSAPLVRVEKCHSCPKPIFEDTVEEQLQRFLNEWRKKDALLSEGMGPPRSLLLKGPPGTGKTMFAKWLAESLGLSLVTLDLAGAISSFLGKTGMNLRRALDFARANECVLLLDEFDAIAKRRDDSTEVGELKRIVNVLLKELEEWPSHSLLIAATNHPELLDPAISRRFDRVFSTSMPGLDERISILNWSLGRFSHEFDKELLVAVCELLANHSGSALNTLGISVVRRHIVESAPLEAALIAEVHPLLEAESKNKKAVGKVVRRLRKSLGENFTIRDIARLTGLVPSTVHYHLHKS